MMKLGDEVLAVVSNGRRYDVLSATLVGMSETLKKVTINGKTERKTEKIYSVDTEYGIENVLSENVFPSDKKQEAKARCNELMGISTEKQKHIEDVKFKRAKMELDELKAYLKSEGIYDNYTWDNDDILINLIKDGYITIDYKIDSFWDSGIKRLSRLMDAF